MHPEDTEGYLGPGDEADEVERDWESWGEFCTRNDLKDPTEQQYQMFIMDMDEADILGA